MSIDGLFPNLTEDNIKLLEEFGGLLKHVWPLKAKHRDHLKYDIRDMSRGLTSDRMQRRKEYMTDDKYLSPYLHYFLPWNLYRMSRLFSGLELDIPENGEVADLGSGSLTAVLALWMSRPHLRERKLNFTCVDLAPKAMQTGLKLFKAMAGDNSPWRIKTVKGSFTEHLRNKADLILAANAFNELDWSGRTTRGQADVLSTHLINSTKETGRVLIVETGMRLSGRIIAEMRAQMLQKGFKPISPCPHSGDCPMPALSQTSPWCHFNFSTKGVPSWLESISKEASLEKDNVTLNFLYLSQKGAADWGAVRAISETFKIQGSWGQYACSDHGLTLIDYAPGTRTLFPGQAFAPTWPETPKTDLKSKAVILPFKADKKK
ncbi:MULTISPECIES: small ribosomal subunit Rsm22 family protein [unclassified Pseudodesulfovibrio]|uniref:small ribosomal subunit Rsm22 family protein n=1 Tax=unclassified Pseudodesulfovibrio TaxID=2661612 RepID=UPI001F4F1762|nr:MULTISPECIES: small ribosomal subunit Rsm22 family protein [unclassified Pseudodesulfovibrio]MCJ2162997.1 rRNA methyltransferase [Pseudodesulfovibrio sp. S3-i]